MDKPFRQHDDRIITVTIDENGDALFLKTNVNDAFLDLGEVITQRASHVEPAPLGERIAFHTLRAIFGDKGRVSDWTRGWNTLWRVNTKPVGGPILKLLHAIPGIAWPVEDNIAVWANRQDAIDAEVKFLNNFFLERGIQ
jgi:hypothetical protein